MRGVSQHVLRLAALVGVAISGWLLVQYLLPVALSACGTHGGCTTVRNCWLGQLGGDLPFWPFLGVLAFGGLLILSLSTSPFARRAVFPAAMTGGVMGLSLIVAQKALCHAFCPYCLVGDVSGIVAAVAAWQSRRDEPLVAPLYAKATYGIAAVAAVCGSFYWGMQHSVPIRGQHVDLPPVIAREQHPGTATIVEFADFECPFCRRQQRELSEFLPAFGSRVHLVRKHVPLAMHPHAEDAARAACCAEEQGRGEAMAEALFTSEDLTPEGCASLATRLGLDMNAYRACLSAPRTTERLARDRDAATQAGVMGLPTVFVGNERFDGVVPASTLRQSIDHALENASSEVPASGVTASWSRTSAPGSV